jgi:hypothetical protein
MVPHPNTVHTFTETRRQGLFAIEPGSASPLPLRTGARECQFSRRCGDSLPVPSG